MHKLEKKINELSSKLQIIKDTQQWTDFNNSINKKLDKIDKDTQKKKVKKFHRDMNDFKTDNIYSWQSKTIPSLTALPNTNLPSTPLPLPAEKFRKSAEHSTPIQQSQQWGRLGNRLTEEAVEGEVTEEGIEEVHIPISHTYNMSSTPVFPPQQIWSPK